MEKTKIVFGIGIVLVVLAVLTAPALAQDPNNVFHLVPVDSSCDGAGCTTTVWIRVDTTYNDINGFSASIIYDPDKVNVTNVVKGSPNWYMWDWNTWNSTTSPYYDGDLAYLNIGGSDLFGAFGPGELDLGQMTLQCKTPGGCALHFANEEEVGGHRTEIGNASGIICGPAGNECTIEDGTFTCIGSEETFNKPLAAGWNLISLPLTATDMTVSNVMASLTYDELYRYDASANSYAPVGASETMANGVGYFINMTAGGGTWTYSGTTYGAMNVAHSDGLNMIGWLNCTKAISATGLDDSANTYYISRWDATTQEYETYNPVAPGDFNDFTEMVRGEGYFISMKTGGTLSESC